MMCSITCPGLRKRGTEPVLRSFIRADATRPGNTEILRIKVLRMFKMLNTLLSFSHLKLPDCYPMKRLLKKVPREPIGFEKLRMYKFRIS